MSPDDPAIWLYALLRFYESQCQNDTDPAGLSWLGSRLYNFACDLLCFTNWSLCRPSASELLDECQVQTVHFSAKPVICR